MQPYHLQAALFPLPSRSQLDALQIWQLLFPGHSPDTFQKPSHSPNTASIAEGPLASNRIMITSSLGRIDLSITPKTPDDPNVTAWILDLAEVLNYFCDCTAQIAAKMKIVRIGLIADLYEQCESDEDALIRLHQLSGAWFPPNSLDVVYQLNVRRNYPSWSSLQMNRVSTWSSGYLQFYQSDIPPPFNSTSGILIAKLPVVNNKLDLNSAGTQEITAQAASLMKDQAEELAALIEHGMDRFK